MHLSAKYKTQARIVIINKWQRIGTTEGCELWLASPNSNMSELPARHGGSGEHHAPGQKAWHLPSLNLKCCPFNQLAPLLINEEH